MVWYEVIRKEDNAKFAVESGRPKDGAYNPSVYDIYVIESAGHPKFAIDEDGNPSVFGPSEGAVLLSEYVDPVKKNAADIVAMKIRLDEAEDKIKKLEDKHPNGK